MAYIPNDDKIKKILLIYIAKHFPSPLTEEQFIKVILDTEFMSYFDYKELCTDLLRVNQLSYEREAGIDIYKVTQDGELILSELSDFIPLTAKVEFKEYYLNNKERIRKDTLQNSNYTYTKTDGIKVNCHVRDGKRQLFNLELFVDSEDEAKNICKNWVESSPLLYQILLDTILREPRE